MVETRPARPADLEQVTRIFFAAFIESIRHVKVGAGGLHALEDILALVLEAEPGNLIVAVSHGKILGYILAPYDVRALRRRIFRLGSWLRVLWRLVIGRYGIGIQTIRIIMADKATFQRGMSMHDEFQARILSVGVHPAAQGQGVGRKLIAAGLEYLRSRDVRGVRLEVRPDNTSALHLYESFGFQGRGEYRDSQGRWLVMIKDEEQAGGAT